MRLISHDDVGYAFLQISQTTEVLIGLYSTSPAVAAVDRDATAALKLWEISESEEALDECLRQIEGTVTSQVGRANASKTWNLLQRKVEVAKVFLAAFREQIENEKQRAAAPGIDEAGEA